MKEGLEVQLDNISRTNIFTPLMKDLLQNLRDSYSRFKVTSSLEDLEKFGLKL